MENFSTMLKVSVIMPVWNSQQYLTKAVESVLAQTFKDFELIALDDGSTDRSLEILQEFENQDSRIRVITGEHQGYSPLLNKGLSMAKGEYIARMDSDDICLENRFAEQVGFLEKNPDYVAVGSQAIRIDPEGDPIGKIELSVNHETIDQSQITGKGKILHPASMIRREALLTINGYRQEFEPGEDFDLFIRLAEVGKLANLPLQLLQYRTHLKNVTVTRKEKHREVKQEALRQAYQRRGINEPIPTISLNDLPGNESKSRFLWMEMALATGFYRSARKNAWLAFQAQPVTPRTIKGLLLGYGGIFTNFARKFYRKIL